MALPKSEKKVRDIMKADEMWKSLIRSEDASEKQWRNNWGWIMDEYDCLHKSLKEKSEESEYLTHVLTEKKESRAQIHNFPNTTNHMYGWIAAHKELQLDKYGSDIFRAKPLPQIYFIPKH
ncbi:uncharacterized protein LOC143204948 [Rhynchophorus ferrugineus]|uniref:Uncharacterized protein n=1 Tax=Rhynchophorus ferrugineus TaxID=354439 RepID=A0A834IM96_RHYFE|nr:hypothetical protein GWI33_005013 [Rhynchophorus ferrugineus]